MILQDCEENGENFLICYLFEPKTYYFFINTHCTDENYQGI